jgi:hypothetical protein
MSRWDEPLPPNRVARWIALHVRAVQIGWAVLVVAYVMFIVAVWLDEGGGATISLLPTLLALVAGGFSFRSMAASVARYDDHAARRDVH